MTQRIRTTCLALTKVVITAAVVSLIGWLFVSGEDHTSVPEASADIMWLDVVPDSKYAKFVGVLKDEGFNPPQSYNWNGNDVFVSYKQTKDSPQDVLYELQTKFFEAEINRDVYSGVPDPESMGDPEAGAPAKMLAVLGANDFVGGGMIPVSNTAEHTAMVGIDTRQQAKNLVEFVAEANEVQSDLDRLIGATRYIEAFRDQSSGTTNVLAVWSDEDLKFSRLGGQGGEVAGDTDLPACPGCTLSSNIDGQGRQSGYAVTTYNSSSTPRSVLDFYHRALVSRGWSPDSSSSIVARTQAHLRSSEEARVYTRQGEALTVQAYRSNLGGSTHVNLFRGR